ncbi:hypothetical protein CC99x_007935 [Candidatus Berkiella cookevillensis]|uniref:Uncharacterized protein n=1 Tax=Candidatus Berkiella cookevillensis TaxID=437022 RepID=A0A0Q9YT70_9GAMM|nr:hypothetical protein [Candidatus Berkiella cookevillensis]MCS5708833.1 hypothetical protein [Candidatus Berkiella cookevillensis]
MSVNGSSSDSPDFTERKAYTQSDRKRTAVLSSSFVPEMPDIRKLEQALESVIAEITPPALKEKLETLYEKSKVRPGTAISALDDSIALIQFSEEEQAKINSLCSQKGTDKLNIFSNSKNATNNIFINKVMELHLADLRQIAKKGSNLKKERVAATQLQKKSSAMKPSGMKLSFSIDIVDIENKDMKFRLDAAYKVLDALMDPKDIEKLLDQSIKNYKPEFGNEIAIVRPIKDYDKAGTNYNILTNMYSQMLVRELNKLKETKYPELSGVSFVDEPVMTLTATSRTDATAYERILKQPFFEVADLAGRNIVINDDHVNAGGFTATLYAASQNLNANILAVSALTTHPHTDNLAPDPSVLDAIRQYTHEAEPDIDGYQRLNTALMQVGLTMEALTNREALTVLAIVMDGNNPEHEKAFIALDESIKKAEVLEGIDDDLRVILKQDPKKASDLAAQIEADMSSSKYARYSK